VSEVDQALFDFFGDNQIRFPIKKLAGDYYLFGSKKILIKINDDLLCVRISTG
jgi:hypothetical protein